MLVKHKQYVHKVHLIKIRTIYICLKRSNEFLKNKIKNFFYITILNLKKAKSSQPHSTKYQ